jgi:serine/threonine protein phosphatase 1
MPAYTGRFTAPAYRRVKKNPFSGGRDFVVSDVHGHIAELRSALADMEFDCARDRLFSVGDLIDRGPSSIECLELLRESWFHAVLANHETMMLSTLRGRYSAYHRPDSWLDNGGAWVRTLSDADKARLAGLLPLVEASPLVISVEHAAGDFNVAHAQLVRPDTGTPYSDKALAEASTLEAGEVLVTWGRMLHAEAAKSPVRAEVELEPGEMLAITGSPFARGLSLTYVGHNPVRQCRLHRSHLHFDRGAGMNWPGGRVLVLEHAQVMARLREAGVAG